MQHPFYLLLLFAILFLFSCNPQEQKKIPPKAVKGVLDLRSVETFPETSLPVWDFDKDGAINLDGEWEFYWKEFVPPVDAPILNSELKIMNSNLSIQNPKSEIQNLQYIPVPSQWQNHGYLVDGYATYRLRVILPDMHERHLSIDMTNVGTSYAMYINGKLASVNGRVGKSKEESIPFRQYRNFSIDGFLGDTTVETHSRASLQCEIEILIHVSNYHHIMSGLWLPFKLGSSSEIEKSARQKLILDLFVIASLLMMGLYHLGLYLNRKKDKTALYFGLFCILFAIRISGMDESVIFDIAPSLPYSIMHKIEFFCFYYGSYVFAQYIHSLFPTEFKEKWIRIVSFILFPLSAIVILFPLKIYAYTLLPAQITVLISVLYIFKVLLFSGIRRVPGAKLVLFSWLIFSISVVNDILVGMSLIHSVHLVQYGFVVFIFLQSITLSKRFAEGFEQSEKLSTDLELKSNRLEETSLELSALMQNLELKISERTKDLEETKKEIEELNTFSHLVNSLPDLNSIFTEISKYFYHKFGITGVWLFLPDEKKEYLQAFKVYSYEKIPADKYDYMMNKKVPLKENEGGIVYKNFQRKKPFYLRKIPKFEFVIDKEMVETLSLISFLQVPLVRKEECVGIFSFSNFGKEMKLSKSDINKITNLCSQIAGSIDTNHLLQQVEKAKTSADSARIEAEIERGISVIAKMEVDKAKQKTEDLNQLIKKVNETSDLERIMSIILAYVKGNYNLPYYSLFTLDSKEEVLKFANAVLPDYVSFEHKKIISSSVFSIAVKNMDSIHSRALALKSPIFIPDIETESKTESSKTILKILKHKSFITLPIILQNNPIGTLDFFSLEPLVLREEEITELSLLAEQLAGIIQGATLFAQVQEGKEKAIVAQKETEQQKQETEELNKLVKSLNEELDIKVILQKVLKYVNENIGVQYYALYTLDTEKNQLAMLDANFPVHMKEEDRTKVLNFKIPVKNIKGVHAFPFKAKRPFFLQRIRKTGGTEEENLIAELYKISSIFIIPLVLNNEIIGTIDFSSETKMELSKEDITKLSILGEQLAGIIHGSNLLKQVQEEKEKALFAQQETERQKQETESLNELIRSLNEDMNIEVIMKKIHGYIKNNYNINYYGLGAVNKDRESLTIIETEMPNYVSEEDRIQISQLKTKIKDKVGAHAIAFKGKKPFFFPRIRRTGLTPEEVFTLEKIKFESLLIIPLILQNEAIGFLDLYNVGKMELSKEDITKLSILGEQLAGIIHGSNLFKQVQEEKEKSQAAQLETEKAKSQVEFLNEFSKVINSFNNLDIIFSHAVENLSNKIETDIFILQLVDKTKNELFARCISGTDSDLIIKYNKKKIPLIPESGSPYLLYTSKKTLYLRNTKRISEDKKTDLDKMYEKDFQLTSLLQIPLLVNEEVIGIMHINKFGGMKKLSKDEIRFVESLCEQLALAVNNSFLLEAAESERAKSEKLLLNILPKDVAAELKEKGFAEPVLFENVSVMFTDFKGFTTIAETLTPQELIKDLDACFVQFDKISERFNLEKLKTIGDSYMCAGGIPKRNKTHAIDCCLAALEIQTFMNLMKRLKEEKGFPYWELRLGIHTGPLIAGVIGERKFAYDVWGDTVNTASRMESSGTPGKINISYSTYEVVKDYFVCEYRGEVSAKNKGVVKMYYLERIKPEFSKDEFGLMPNGKFWEVYG